MSDANQKQLGNTLWKIADDLRGAMNADDFRVYMLSFLFLRYLSDNYELARRAQSIPQRAGRSFVANCEPALSQSVAAQYSASGIGAHA